jgi:hypothetical protein
MLLNDLLNLAMGIPPTLAAQWGVWFLVGLTLSIWTRREKSRLVVEAPAHGHWSSGSRPATRPKSSGSRPVARPTSAPHVPVSGDAFGELEALFNEVQEGSHRPGDPAPAEPSLSVPASSEPAVIETAGSEPLRNAPALAAPQSLP